MNASKLPTNLIFQFSIQRRSHGTATSADFDVERSLLMTKVYKRLRKYCRNKYGVECYVSFLTVIHLIHHTNTSAAPPHQQFSCTTTPPLQLHHHTNTSAAPPHQQFSCTTTPPLQLHHHTNNSPAPPHQQFSCTTTPTIQLHHHANTSRVQHSNNLAGV